MTRPTMANLIISLRGMTNAGTADYTVAGSAYWSSDQLQTVLDRYRVEVREELLSPFAVTVGDGSVNWYDYQSSYRWLESTDGGTARFFLADSTGAKAGTALWTAEYERGLITFGSNTGGTVYYLTGYSFDVYAAAADVWRQKASQYATAVDFTTDNHSIKRGSIIDHCLKMEKYYSGLATTSTTGGSSTMERGDTR